MRTYMFHKKANIHFLKSETKIGEICFVSLFLSNLENGWEGREKKNPTKIFKMENILNIEILLPTNGIELGESVIPRYRTIHYTTSDILYQEYFKC